MDLSKNRTGLKKRSALLLTVLFIFILLTGCSSGKEEEVEDVAVSFTTNILEGNWEEATKLATGEQLSALILMSDQLSQTQFESEVRTVEVDQTIVEKDKALVTIHTVRDMTVEGMGTFSDDRTYDISLTETDEGWKVYDMRLVSEN